MTMHIRYFIPWVSLSVMVGCAAAYVFVVPLLVPAVTSALISVAVLVLYRHPSAVLIGVCAVAFFLGMVRVIYPQRYAAWSPAKEYPGPVTVYGVITGDIETRGNYSRYVMHVREN